MSAFCLPITCPTCGADVELVNGRTNGLLSVAVVECGPCGREWEVTVRLSPHGASRAATERAAAVQAETKRRVRAMATA